MHILILHNLSDKYAGYSHAIDHDIHDVTYVGTASRMEVAPAGIRATRRERGPGDTATAVLAAIADLPKPDLVVALSEFDLIPAAQVREALGVTGPTVRETMLVRDKVLMKSAVLAAGLNVPRFTSLDEAVTVGVGACSWSGPTVLKPRAGASSRHISTFATAEQALEVARLGALPADITDFEVEEFIEGPVIHIDGIVASGAPFVVQASRYVGTCLGYADGVPLGSVQFVADTETLTWTLRCLKAVGIDQGPFHLEAIKGADGLCFLEVAARCGSGGVVDACELATGIRLPSAALRLQIDGPSTLPRPRVPEADGLFGWFVFPGHTLGARHCHVSGEDRFRNAAPVYRWFQRGIDEPVADSISYALAKAPLGGLLGPGSTEELELFLTDLFGSVRVEPHHA